MCSVTSVTIHMSLFLIHPRGELQSLWSVQTYRACYRSKPTGPVIGLFLQGQLSVCFYKASYRFIFQGQLSIHVYRANYWSTFTGPMMVPFLQGQWSVYFFKASDSSIFSGPVIGPFLQIDLFLQGQWLAYFFRASYRSIPVSPNTGQFTSRHYWF